MLHHFSKTTIRILEAEVALSTLMIIGGFLAVTSSASALKYYQTHLFPGTEMHGYQVESKNSKQIFNNFDIKNPPTIPNYEIKISVDNIQTSSSFLDTRARFNYALAVENQLRYQNSLPWHKQLVQIISGKFTKAEIPVPISIDKSRTKAFLESFARNVDIEGREPDVYLEYSNIPSSLVVDAGEPSRWLDIDKSYEELNKQVAFAENEIDFRAIVASGPAVLSQTQVTQTKELAKKLIGKKIELKHDTTTQEITDQDLIEMITPPNKVNQDVVLELVESWQEDINRPAINAEFSYNPENLKVEKFKPHRVGRELLVEENVSQITQILEQFFQNPDTIENKKENLLVEEIQPKVTLEDTNSLGIKERIGFGESYYDHSIPNRIHNVGITADRISLTIVAPGEAFSFNQALGEVSQRTGYRPAYVISGGRTILGDGGGVCQVSSTLFRALLDSGLKITRRIPHSYRVSYYELNSDPGFDATVYSGNVDLRFENDTPNHILIYSEAYNDQKYMFMEIYGTDDGREVEIANYRKFNQRGPLPPEYYDSTDIPAGEIRQIDWAASGISTEFTRTVKDKNGNTMYEDTYTSYFRPWAAKFLRGV